jgi:ABC-type thiamin/hydroxymethylpyrimidine transport system permease subunit
MSQGQLARIRQHIANNEFRTLGWKKVAPTGMLLACMGLLAWKAYSSWEALQEFEWEIRCAWLVPSISLYLIQTLAVVWVWRSLWNHLAPPVPFRKHLKIYCYTKLLWRIPAGLLWQAAGRVYWYHQLDIPIASPTLASFLELELAILTGLPFAAAQVGAITVFEPGYAALISGLVVVVVAVLLQPNLLDWILRVFKQNSLQIDLPRWDALGWVATYALVWLLSGASLYVTVNLFYDLPLQALPEIIGVWTLASLVSYLTLLTPGGFGVKELSLTFLLGFYLPEPLPLVVALAIRVLWTVYEIVAGLAAMAFKSSPNSGALLQKDYGN